MGRNASDMLGAGLSSLVVQSINGSLQDSLTATGTSQATGFPIVSDHAIFTTVASGTAATLPSNAQGGDEKVVVNLGANALLVFPPVGGTIQGAAANASFSVGNGKTAHFLARSGGKNWIVNLSA